MGVARIAILFGILSGPVVAHASDQGFSAVVRAKRAEETAPPPRYVDLRLGAASSAQLVLCGQLSYGIVSIEGCGTGAGLFAGAALDEVSHYRAHVALKSWKTPIGWVSPRVGVGFAELQTGADSPGFAFSSVDALGAATAGPEATLGLQWLLRLGGGFELVTDVSAFAAWFPHAPELVDPRDPVQAGVLVSTGVGF